MATSGSGASDRSYNSGGTSPTSMGAASTTTSTAFPSAMTPNSCGEPQPAQQSLALSSVRGSPSQYVKLNVGGSLQYTTIGTLTKGDNMLRAMFSGRMEVRTDAEGWILIDRCGKHFGTILNFLRDGNVPLPENRSELAELRAEAKYFCVEELAEACEKSMKDKEAAAAAMMSDVVPICRVPLITSPKEEQVPAEFISLHN